MKWTIDRTSALAFSLTLLSLFVVSTLAFDHTLGIMGVTRSVWQAHIFESALEQTRSAVLDMESSQKGYLAAHSAHSLIPFKLAQNQLKGSLYELTEVSPEQVQYAALERLRAKISNRLELFDTTNQLVAKGDFAAALKLVQGPGQELTDQICRLVTEMESVENQRLLESVRSLDLVNEQTLAYTIFATVVCVAVLMLAFILMSRQLLGRKTNEERERREKEMFNAMLTTMGDGVIVADKSEQILIFNPAAQQIFGKGQSQIPLEQWSKEYGFYYTDKRTLVPAHEQPLLMALKGETVDGLELYIHNDVAARGVYVSVTGRTLYDQNQQPRAAVIVLHDITQRKMAEQRLNEFYAVLSHELRTPLTSIRGSLGLLEGGIAGELSVMALELVGIARSEVDRLVRLVNNILDLKKIEAGKLQLVLAEVKPEQIVQTTLSALASVAQETSVTLEIDIQTLSSVRCDPDRIIQVLTNLLSNALKFAPAKSKVRVAVADSGAKVRFSITDRGPGIPAHHVALLFHKFQQLETAFGKRKGTGLGLAISKALVEQHGGSIGVESIVGEGSCFWFELPVFVDDGSGISTQSTVVSGWIRI